MKNGIVSLRGFEILDRIRSPHSVADGDWAEASGLKYQSRISELRRMADLERTKQDPSKIGRAFSVSKCLALLDGLKIILGGSVVTKELLKLLDKSKTQDERILIMTLALDSGPEKDQLELYLKALLSSSSR